MAAIDTLEAYYSNIAFIDEAATPAGDQAVLNLLAGQVDGGTRSLDEALDVIVDLVDDTTSVAALAYNFFQGSIPTEGGFEFLVAPAGPNPNNLNSPYYAQFNIENRYINFAVNLGVFGDNDFDDTHNPLSFFESAKTSYIEIFGVVPTDEKINEILDAQVPNPDGSGGTISRLEYFQYYGGTDLGAKAAIAGWFLGEAAKADIGIAANNELFLEDLAVDGVAQFGTALETSYPTDGTGTPGQIFTLTDVPDTIPGLIGSNGTADTSGDDTIVALLDTGNDTLSPGDDINAGPGEDLLRVTTTGNSGNIDLSVADIQSVEAIELNINGDNTTDIDFSDENSEFAEIDVDFRGNDLNVSPVDITNLGPNSAISVSNINDGNGFDLDFEFNEAAGTLSGGSLTLTNVDSTGVNLIFDNDGGGTAGDDSFTLNLDGVTQDNAADSADFYIEDIENLTINVTGDSEIGDFEAFRANDASDFGPQTVTINLGADLEITESVDLTDTAEEARVVITGAGNLTIAQLGDGSGDPDLTVDASAATGNIDLGVVEAAVTGLEVTLGSGDDRVALEQGLAFADVRGLDGGDGTDRLGLDADDLANLGGLTFTNFEVLEVTGAAAAAVSADVEDFQTVVLSADVVNDITLEDFNDGTLVLETDQPTSLITVEGESASETLRVEVAEGVDQSDLDLTLTDVTELTIDLAVDADIIGLDLIAGDLTTLTVTSDPDDAGAGFTLTTLDADNLETVNLQGVTGTLNVTMDDDSGDLTINLGDFATGSSIALEGTGDATDTLVFGEFSGDTTLNLTAFEAGSGAAHDILDLSAFGLAPGDLTIVDNAVDTTITFDDTSGDTVELTLLGVTGVAAADIVTFNILL